MTQHELALWNRIKAFQFDDSDTYLTFAKRLARENGWSSNYTEAVIEEYKKFIFLCCISDKPITPSDQVDQAWHLHMIYTKSYWNNFCSNTLQNEIHHNPTKGGSKEGEKFKNLYAHTFLLYQEKFKQDVPKQIWLNADKRFSEIDFQRINVSKFWIIQKPSKALVASGLLFVILIAGLLNIQSEYTGTFGFIAILILIVGLMIYISTKSNGGKGNSGCSAGSGTCSSSHNHDSGSGGDSGCSGCGGCGGGD